MTIPDAAAAAPAGWYPDRLDRHELRYFDGIRWTEHVTSHGQQSVDRHGGPTAPAGGRDSLQAHPGQRVAAAGVAAPVSGTAILSEPLLVVMAAVSGGRNGPPKAAYVINDGNGRQIGSMWHPPRAHSVHVVDLAGNVLLWVPTTYTLFSRLIVVQDADGTQLCRVDVRIPKVRGKIRASIEVGGLPAGSIGGDSWLNLGFTIQDPAGTEIGRITTKGTYSGSVLGYVVQTQQQVENPRRSLVTAAVIATLPVIAHYGYLLENQG